MTTRRPTGLAGARTAEPWNRLASDEGGIMGVAPAGGGSVGRLSGGWLGAGAGGDDAAGLGADLARAGLARGSANGAPQNLQNCAVGSLVPRQRAQTRGASTGGGLGARRSTIGVGAMGLIDGAGGAGCRGGGAGSAAGGATTGAVRTFEGAAGSTELPQETQKRVPSSFNAPQRAHLSVARGMSALTARGCWKAGRSMREAGAGCIRDAGSTG
jgi:hypothetical protein